MTQDQIEQELAALIPCSSGGKFGQCRSDRDPELCAECDKVVAVTAWARKLVAERVENEQLKVDYESAFQRGLDAEKDLRHKQQIEIHRLQDDLKRERLKARPVITMDSYRFDISNPKEVKCIGVDWSNNKPIEIVKQTDTKIVLKIPGGKVWSGIGMPWRSVPLRYFVGTIKVISKTKVLTEIVSTEAEIVFAPRDPNY